jgi:serine/threonine-protein kinase RsbW
MPAVRESHRVEANLSEVGRLNELLSERWSALELPPEHEMPVTLALEEILSNAIRHSAPESGPAQIGVEFVFEPNAFQFAVSDNGRAFNPLQLPEFDPNAPLESRRAGGMGVHIVKQLADELRYEYREGNNVLTFRKHWSS